MIYQVISTIFLIAGNYIPSFGMMLADGHRAPVTSSGGGLSFITDTMYDMLMKVALGIADNIVVALVIPFLGLFIILEVFWDIIRQRIKDDGAQNFTLRQPIILILLILVCVFYTDLATQLDRLSNSAINEMSYVVAGGKNKLADSQRQSAEVMARISNANKLSGEDQARPLDETEEMLEDKIQTVQKVKSGEGTEEETASVVDMMVGMAQWETNNMAKSVEDVLFTLVYAASKLIRMTMEGIAFVLSMLLIGLGPLAILSYAIPGDIGKGAITQTLGTFFQYKLWIILIFVIDALLVQSYQAFYIQRIGNSMDPNNWNFGDNFVGVIMILGFLVLYLAVPKITTVIMQRGDAAGLKAAAVSSVKSGVNVVKNVSTGNWGGLAKQMKEGAGGK